MFINVFSKARICHQSCHDTGSVRAILLLKKLKLLYLMVNKTTIKKLMLSALALLAVGSMNAATETYNFTSIATGTTITALDKVGTEGGNDVNLVKIGDNTLGSRFALHRYSSGWSIVGYTQNGVAYKGLRSEYDRYMYVMNLKAGDKVTVTWKAEDADGKLTFVDAAVVTTILANAVMTSGTEYTVGADGNLRLFVAKGSSNPKLCIEKVVIETAAATEAIHIGKKTEYYNLEKISGSIDKENDTYKTDPLIISGTTYSRFSVERGDLVKIAGSGYGIQTWYNKETADVNIVELSTISRYTTSKTTGSDGNTEFWLRKGDLYQVNIAKKGYTMYNQTTALGVKDLAISKMKSNSNFGQQMDLSNISITTDETITAGTLVSNSALDFSEVSGLTAYVATAANSGTVKFSPVTKVAANTPIYLKADNAGIYDVPVFDGTGADAIATNLLRGSATATTSLTSTNDTKYYVFGVKDNEAGFYPVSTSSALISAAGKAYLELTVAQAAAASRIAIVFAYNETTGIEALDNWTISQFADSVYDLSGRKLSNDQLSNGQIRKGLYIVNGKKIFVK